MIQVIQNSSKYIGIKANALPRKQGGMTVFVQLKIHCTGTEKRFDVCLSSIQTQQHELHFSVPPWQKEQKGYKNLGFIWQDRPMLSFC